MSYTRIEANPAYPEKQGAILPQLERISRIVLWAIAHGVLLFAEHAAELAAPFLLLGGALWWAIPQILSAITLDGQANDMLQIVRSHVPHEVLLGGSYISPSSLIYDGVLCVAVVAICRTLTVGVTALMLDRR